MGKKEQPNEKSYFRDAVVESGGRTYHLSVEDGRAIESAGNYWHGPGDPSSWLIVATFLEARRRVGEAGTDVALELAAKALGITVEKIRQGIDWHEHYMQWHDGDPDYKIL
jgi:hypothetical protein